MNFIDEGLPGLGHSSRTLRLLFVYTVSGGDDPLTCDVLNSPGRRPPNCCANPADATAAIKPPSRFPQATPSLVCVTDVFEESLRSATAGAGNHRRATGLPHLLHASP